MIKKILCFFFIININIVCFAENKFEIIATVNNISITKLDLKNELTIIKLLNNKNFSQNLANIALNNLINEKLKHIEIKEKKLKIDKKKIDYLYNILLKDLMLDNSNIEKNIQELIKEKIKIDKLWNLLVSEKYAWKININMQEINKKISQNNKDNKNYNKIKEQLIVEEKNKKMQVYDKFYLNQLRGKALIKIF